ncbi:MAG: hypothetical protein RJB01_723 [Actinomycetota bacterium]|jgi:acyl-CoA thioester hydrolase
MAIDIVVEKRFKDIDPANHVSNTTILDYVMEARVRLYLAIDPDLRNSGAQVVARQEIDYRRPILYSADPVIVRTWISHIGNTSFTVDCHVIDGGVVAAEAKTVMVSYDFEAGAPMPIPDWLRAGLAEHHTVS